MADLNVNSIGDASGGATTSINGFTPSVSNMAGRNRIINGDMRIDQRNAGASVTPTDGQYTLDRWNAGLTQASKFSVQQSSVAPTGFTKSLLVTSLSAYSVASGDLFRVSQYIEGFNTSDLGWGTAGAKSVTLSFWVRSSLTGTFSGALLNSAIDRSYPFTYTISSADTWEQKSVTIAGDTSGSWLTTNGIGVRVGFSLGAGATFSGTAGAWAGATYTAATGATSVVGTSGATFYITGVQLEEGSVATPFCPAGGGSYGAELALCQRYYWKQTKGDTGSQTPIGTGWMRNATLAITCVRHPVPMRATPSFTSASGSAYFHISTVTDYDVTSLFLEGSNYLSTQTASIAGVIASGSDTGGAGMQLYISNASAYFSFSAEL